MWRLDEMSLPGNGTQPDAGEPCNTSGEAWLERLQPVPLNVLM